MKTKGISKKNTAQVEYRAIMSQALGMYKVLVEFAESGGGERP
jgi:hypothetical protein